MAKQPARPGREPEPADTDLTEHEVATGHPEAEEFSPPTAPARRVPPESVVTRPMTFGEKAVGLSFNPSGDPTVNKLKALYAQIIDVCHEERQRVNQGRITTGPPVEAARLWSIAITEAQGGQMWAVKAATWRD